MNASQIEQLNKAMSQAGISPPSNIIADGEIHRFSTGSDPSKKSGWYILFSGDIHAGAFGDFRKAIKKKWRADIGREYTAAEHKAYTIRMNVILQKHKAEKSKIAAAAKKSANEIWDAAEPVKRHAYLTSKAVKAYDIRKQNGILIIPMRDAYLNIHSLQRIWPDGNKRFLSDGRIKGCYFSIGKPNNIIYICEGYATGASIHEATDEAVVVAFNAGNLPEVAQAIRTKFPDIEIVICADDDYKNDKNIGIIKAKEAALLVDGSYALPIFGDDRPDGATDFNDLHQHQELDAVRASLATVAKVQASDIENQGWSSPLDLLQKSDSSPYPIKSLPNTMQAAVNEVINFVQCPPALAASSALSALSLAAQHLADISRAEGLTSPISLFILAIAESGERKSSVDSHFTKSIRDWENNEVELAEPDVKQHKAEHLTWRSECEGLSNKIKSAARKSPEQVDELRREMVEIVAREPKPILVPRLIYADATPEQMGFSLAKNWPSGGVISSEAGVVFGSHGMKSDSVMSNMALLNTCWDGGSHTVDRRNSESYKVQGARLTMGLAVQPITLNAFIGKTAGLARGTGFLARFLISMPKSTQGSRMFREPPELWPKLSAFTARLTEFLNEKPTLTETGGLSPITLNFSTKAKAEWVKCHDEIELELQKGGSMEDARDVASKAADNIARLAALFHVYERGAVGLVQSKFVVNAAAITKWYMNEAKRFLNQIAIPTHISNAIKLDEFILRYCSENNVDKVPQNHVLKHGPIRGASFMKEPLAELVESHRIKILTDGKAKIIQVNPELLGGEKTGE